ncbi:hypothetical protein Taro_010793 [Colocasia esculenta]|uniref:Proteasome subunit beta n=1 Tax=Colocasia esculenta TaxID=4460 RepID=A0A843U419_COLES|nr:hypothetical protein [Colocasia esculenta]
MFGSLETTLDLLPSFSSPFLGLELLPWGRRGRPIGVPTQVVMRALGQFLHGCLGWAPPWVNHEQEMYFSTWIDWETSCRYPYVTGTSVIGIKYKDGVLMAADTGGSYGSTLRYKSVERIKPIGKHSLLGASGEISDFQELLRYLDELILYDNMWDDGNSLGPKEIHNYLTRVMYNRRNKFNPLWNSLVLGGVKNGQKYLGVVTMLGAHFEDKHVATGFGNHLAVPILRSEWKEDMNFEEAVKLLEKCLLVLLYRDRSSINKFQIAKITEEGATIYPAYSLKTFWGFSAFQNPAKCAEGTW